MKTTAPTERPAVPPGRWHRSVLALLGEHGLILIFALWALFLTVRTDRFATTDNIFTILRQAAVIGVVAIGAHIIILMGDIDLSPAATLGLCGVVMAKLIIEEGFSPAAAGLAAMLLGIMIGSLNGFLVTIVQVNSVIATLGVSSILYGLALRLTAGKTVYGDPLEAIEFLSRADVPKGGVPLPAVILIGLYGAAYLLLQYTVFGRWVFAIGSNRSAAWMSGINVKRVKIFAYILAGMLAGFGGVMQVARQGTATSNMGADFLFPILTAVILGGTKISGGHGKIMNTLIAVIFLTSIRDGLILLGYGVDIQRMASGALLILALSLNHLRK